MYESPMNKIAGEITEEINRQDEKNCMVSIRQAVGYQVDKEELIKALNYDRNQYEKGFTDALDKIRAEIWDLQYGDEEKSMTDEDRADAYNNAIKQVIEIIDKYKAESVEGGTSLPEGHGRLIDADKLRAEYTKPHLVGYDEIIADIDRQPTVVESEGIWSDK